MALAAFSLSSVRNKIAPNSTFTLITQNVDGLSIRAQQYLEAAAAHTSPVLTEERSELLEMHGRVHDVMCSSVSCGHVEFNTSSPICESLGGTEELVGAGVMDPNIPVASLPHCPDCGALARPGVVWFGEIPQHLDTIQELVDQAQLCLVIGTSSTVSAKSMHCSESLIVCPP